MPRSPPGRYFQVSVLGGWWAEPPGASLSTAVALLKAANALGEVNLRLNANVPVCGFGRVSLQTSRRCRGGGSGVGGGGVPPHANS